MAYLTCGEIAALNDITLVYICAADTGSQSKHEKRSRSFAGACDILTSGGILENKRIGDLAQRHGVAMAVHMAESPVSAYACVHSVAATENFYVLENHSVDVPWWNDITLGHAKPLVRDGFIDVPDAPGLGVDDYNDEVLREHLHPDYPELWADTGRWDDVYSHDRTWS